MRPGSNGAAVEAVVAALEHFGGACFLEVAGEIVDLADEQNTAGVLLLHHGDRVVRLTVADANPAEVAAVLGTEVDELHEPLGGRRGSLADPAVDGRQDR